MIVAADLVDIATARLDDDEIRLLVGREASALELAISERLFRFEPQLREGGDDGGLGRMQFLANELARVPRMVAESDDEGEGFPAMGERQSTEAATIREMIRARRLRDELFGEGLFADPAWDILLDLTAARIERRSVAVSSLCIAAAVPATTALRWIKQLTDAGLLRRVADPDDGRRVFIELTERAADAMTTYFGALSRGGRG